VDGDPSALRLTAVHPQPVLQAGPVRVTGVVPDGGPALEVGEARDVGGVRFIGLPTENARDVALVVGHAGRILLWCPTSARLGEAAFDALEGAGLNGVLLGLGNGESDGTDDTLDVAHTLARLRRAAALAEHAVVRVLPPAAVSPPRLRRLRARLSTWGAAAAEDGDALAVRTTTPAPARPSRTLVLGAAASGKSAVAEDLLAAEPEVVYAATGPAPGPDDLDWAQRVQRHRARRPAWWQTVEDDDLAVLLSTAGPPVLVDSLGTWVTAVLTAAGAWDDVPGWSQRYEREVDDVVRAWRSGARRVVAVGEETGWGVVPETASGRRFRDALGAVTRRLADESDQVLLVVAGRVVDVTALEALDMTTD
jgi:adenosylcobinamide kinase/adenosylcobinamide-phosphate guanylyltransferase